MGNTYDAYVHIFFAEHYSHHWFEPWNYKWYTGFTMTSYPPLIHHIIALLSKVIGLKLGFIVCCLCSILLFVRGCYHFAKIWVSDVVAGYAAVLAVFLTSYVEAVHLFGQLPSITGIAILLNACPELYKWIRFNKISYFVKGVSLLACLTCAHHVTTIFGAVFFIAPVLGVAVMDVAIEEQGGIEKLRFVHFVEKVWTLKWKAILIGCTTILIVICMIFPYWYWSKTDPITQISIPHGSRADFLAEPNLGLVFFLIPWGVKLFFLIPILDRIFRKRNIFLGLSFSLLFILGTGGTTPIPKLILGENAFNILTLDRFTFWATIIALPFFASIIYSLIEGSFASFLREKIAPLVHKVILFCIAIMIVLTNVLTINMSNMQPMQPDPVDIDPIVQFLERDGHDRWRYMTLGFGDQMAWLAAHTNALSVDGNYHSARRLPELTTKAIERIENSKYLGEQGLSALRDFLSVPEKYNLKYIFNNDKFYESALAFYGWSKLNPLENNIDVWERKGVNDLPSILPKKKMPRYQKIMWGILPLSSLIIALLVFLFLNKKNQPIRNNTPYTSSKNAYFLYSVWFIFIFLIVIFQLLEFYKNKNFQSDPEALIHNYFHLIDYKKLDEAYQLLYNKENISQEQYMLERSLEDGLLASYAKLDTIIINQIESVGATIKEVHVTSKWLTAVQRFDKKYKLILRQENDLWYIQHDSYEKDVTPDQFIRLPDVDFLNHGKRQALAGVTQHEDILDRPEIYIDQAQLITKDSTLHIVGHITNTDVDPSYINIKGILYDSLGQEIINNNAEDITLHNLLPKEGTPFRIDFPAETSKNILASHTDGSDIEFAVFVSSVVTDEKLYKYYGIKDIVLLDDMISCNIINYGNRQITIPQVLITYSQDNKITWVDKKYLDNGVRSQREKSTRLKLKYSKTKTIASGTDENLIVNGTKRDAYHYVNKEESETILKYHNETIELKLNAFIAQN